MKSKKSAALANKDKEGQSPVESQIDSQIEPEISGMQAYIEDLNPFPWTIHDGF